MLLFVSFRFFFLLRVAEQHYYALVANAKFLLSDEEHFAELIRERVRYLRENEKEINFWIIPEPSFVLDAPGKFSNVSRPCAALVSTDEVWANFMKLRLDKVLLVDLGVHTDPADILKSQGDVPDYPKPSGWTAPYPQYTPGWWRKFATP